MIKGWKRQEMDLENYLQISDKGLTRIYYKCLKINNKKTNILIWKIGKTREQRFHKRG